MGKALQCPECGARHPLDELQGVRTFRCSSCRRLLKVPQEIQVGASEGRGRGGGASKARGGGARAAAGASGAAATGAGAKGAAAKGAAATGSAASGSAATGSAATGSAATGAAASTELAPGVDDEGRRVPPSQRGVDLRAYEAERRADRRASTRAPSARGAGDPAADLAGDRQTARVPRPLRLFIWILAVPIGVVPVLFVGRLVGVVTIDTVMDVFVAEGWRRYLLPLVVLPSWAAVTATIVHLAVEGLGRLLGRPPEDGP